MDQVGAIIGPIVFSPVLLFHGDCREGFTLLWIPALLTLAILALARRKFPSPQKLEEPGKTKRQSDKGKLPRVFWLYTIFTLLSAGGFASFQLISCHLHAEGVVPDAQIPLIYAIAMGVDATSALLVGKTYDRLGLTSLLAVPLLAMPIPFLAFSHSYGLVLAGMVLWGVVMGIQETIMRAAIADLPSVERRGFAYGIFNTAYGASWFLGLL